MHSRLEQYLHTVEQNLGALPAEERHNELNEIRLHMEALLEANRELCDNEEEAITQTLTQFGRARALGKDLTHVHQSKNRSRLDTLPGVLVFSYLSSYLVSLVFRWIFMATPTPSQSVMIVWMVLDLLKQFCLGALTGVMAPCNAVRGTFYARLVSVGLGLLLMFRYHPPVAARPEFWVGELIGTAINVSLAIGGVKLGIFWRKRRAQRKQFAH